MSKPLEIAKQKSTKFRHILTKWRQRNDRGLFFTAKAVVTGPEEDEKKAPYLTLDNPIHTLFCFVRLAQHFSCGWLIWAYRPGRQAELV